MLNLTKRSKAFEALSCLTELSVFQCVSIYTWVFIYIKINIYLERQTNNFHVHGGMNPPVFELPPLNPSSLMANKTSFAAVKFFR